MKSIKIMLLGIAAILWGIACKIVMTGYEISFVDYLGIVLIVVGFVVTVIGFFKEKV